MVITANGARKPSTKPPEEVKKKWRDGAADLSSPPLAHGGNLLPPCSLTSSVDAPYAAGTPVSIFVFGDANCGDNTLLPLTPICLDSRLRLLPNLIAERMGLPPPPPFYGANLTVPLAGVNLSI